MSFWSPFPFVRLIVPFSLGIVLAINHTKLYNIILIILLIIYFILCLHIKFNKLLITYRTRWIFGFFVQIFLFIYGFELASTSLSGDSKQFFKEDIPIYYTVQVLKPLSERASSFGGFVRVIGKKKDSDGKV